MSHGGARKGAGRKPGQANKINAQARKKALEGGITPLEYMLKVMRNTNADEKRRDDMAKAAAPYVHARAPQAVEHSGHIGTYDLSKLTDEQIDSIESILGPLAVSGGDTGGEGAQSAAEGTTAH